MIRNRVLESLLGLMEEPTRVIGRMGSKMGRGHTETKKDAKKMEHG